MSRATGRHTRPKKLNAKQTVQIFREDQVDSLLDADASRTTIETGVEKAEEAVCFCCCCCGPPACTCHYFPPPLLFCRLLSLCPLRTPISHPPFLAIHSHHQNALKHPHLAVCADLVCCRNTISNKPSKRPKPQRQTRKSKMHTFPRHLPLPVMSNMTYSIPSAFNSRPRTSAPRPRSKTVQECHIAWTKRMNLP